MPVVIFVGLSREFIATVVCGLGLVSRPRLRVVVVLVVVLWVLVLVVIRVAYMINMMLMLMMMMMLVGVGVAAIAVVIVHRNSALRMLGVISGMGWRLEDRISINCINNNE